MNEFCYCEYALYVVFGIELLNAPAIPAELLGK
jgi:hypothetical protein